jgi:DnaD/phage-associated family protein
MVWWSDFWESDVVTAMDGIEAALYLEMLTLAWHRGTHVGVPALPASVPWIANHLRLDRKSQKIVQKIIENPAGIWTTITVNGKSYWANPRQLADWDTLNANAEKARQKATFAANARWHQDAPSTASSTASSNASSMLPAMPEHDASNAFPSPSPNPIDLNSNNNTRARADAIDWRRLDEAWFRYLGGSLSATAREDLPDLLREGPDGPALSEDVVILAFAEANRNNAKTWAYVSRILANWRAAGICTLAAAQQHVEQFAQQRQRLPATRASPADRVRDFADLMRKEPVP